MKNIFLVNFIKQIQEIIKYKKEKMILRILKFKITKRLCRRLKIMIKMHGNFRQKMINRIKFAFTF